MASRAVSLQMTLTFDFEPDLPGQPWSMFVPFTTRNFEFLRPWLFLDAWILAAWAAKLLPVIGIQTLSQFTVTYQILSVYFLVFLSTLFDFIRLGIAFMNMLNAITVTRTICLSIFPSFNIILHGIMDRQGDTDKEWVESLKAWGALVSNIYFPKQHEI